MIIFVDTSAFYTLLDADDANHARAKTAWAQCLDPSARLSSSNYVLLETMALIQHRLGMVAVRRFHEEVVPLLHVHWINSDLHAVAVSAVLAAGRRNLSLVDCASFEVMRQLNIRTVFAFDPHFAEQGFACLPE